MKSLDFVLQTHDLQMAFAGLKIFDDLNFNLKRGERHAVIGPNGAGKSTFINLVTGVLNPTGGRITFQGKDITTATAQQRVKAGLVRTFQINTLFPAINPLESILIALFQRDGLSLPSLRSIATYPQQVEEAQELLKKFGLSYAALAPTATLPYGEQRMLEVALAFAMRPRVLLLDEPAAGLTTAQGAGLFEHLLQLDSDITVLFIEHDMHLVFKYANRVSVFAGGMIISQGTPDEVRADPLVTKAYLG